MLSRDMPVASDGTVYVSDTYKDRLCAVTPSGRVKWAYRVGDTVDAAPAIGPDGTVYVACSDCKLYALTPDGRLKWTFKTGDSIMCAPAVGGDGTVYVVSDNGHSDSPPDRLYAISPSGALQWSYAMRGTESSNPAVDSSGTVYVGDGDVMYAVGKGGKLKWSYRTGDAAMSPAIDAHGTVYFGGSQDDKFYAITSNGKLRWSISLGDSWVDSPPSVGSDGTIYAGVEDVGLYAFAPGGTTKWIYPIKDLSTSSPAFGPDGTIYIGSGERRGGAPPQKGPLGHLYALTSSGALAWSTPIRGLVECRPAVDTAGRVYVADSSGRLSAFGP